MICVWFRNYEHDLSENKIQCFHGLGFALRMCLLQIIFLPRKMELAQVKTSTGMAMLDGLRLRNILRFLRIRGRMVCFIAGSVEGHIRIGGTITMFCCGRNDFLSEVELTIYVKIVQRNNVMWNTIILGYSRNGDMYKACDEYRKKGKRKG
ncbi:uncharacterized protein LOC131647062 [Vicia villosa]|uniref:uncharacterized protein LOC131647062 n=1 Tax=Vicia villosa TaxID=3911 RepID=UPI00273CE3C9|nr:uncharacterized protein LOC131647062 [Vicia villosa]XP_058772960.1 uncharacterized protein LOC131647062 [Vicia villosa]